MKLLPYSEGYRESTTVWASFLPSHWQFKRLGSLLKERGEVNHDYREENVLSVLRDIGVIPYADKGNVGNKKSEDIARYKIVRPNDIVLNSMNVIIGSVGRSRYQGCLSPVYYVLTPRSSELTPEFAESIFQVKPFQQSLIRIGYGILAHRMRIPMELLKSEVLPVPPLAEQEQIVRFVRHLDSKVNRLIKAKRRLIELLSEQKQAIIHQAVTRGIDPTIPLKPSGLDWLDYIPATWEIRKIKDVAAHNPSKTELRGLQPETPVTVLPMEAVSEWGLVSTTMEEKLGSVQGGLTYMRNGDVAIAKITPCFENGKGAPLLGLPCGFAFGSTEFHVLRPQPGVTTDFLYFVTRMPKFRELGELNMKGSAGQKRVPSDFVKNFEFGLPTPVEQEQIVSHLRQVLAGIDRTADKVRAEIDLIREYRTRLVADVVTGQLDVRQHPWANTEIEDSTEVISDDAELEDGLEETDDVLEETGV